MGGRMFLSAAGLEWAGGVIGMHRDDERDN